MPYPYDSAYLLRIFDRLAGRPPADAVTPASKYERLSEAQDAIVADIAGICPWVLYPTVAYGSIPTLTTVDNQNYTFGTDANGFALAPMGKVALYRQLTDIPSHPMRAGVDYIPLGATMIQAPNNGTLPSTIYWRGISPPGVIDGSGTNEPVLFPEASRVLIALRAAIEFLTEQNRNPVLAAQYAIRYGRPFGVQPGLFAQWCLNWQTQFRGGGVLGSLSGRQVAVGSQTGF